MKQRANKGESRVFAGWILEPRVWVCVPLLGYRSVTFQSGRYNARCLCENHVELVDSSSDSGKWHL